MICIIAQKEHSQCFEEAFLNLAVAQIALKYLQLICASDKSL